MNKKNSVFYLLLKPFKQFYTGFFLPLLSDVLFFFLANLIFLNIEKIVLVQEIVLFYRFTKIDILI